MVLRPEPIANTSHATCAPNGSADDYIELIDAPRNRATFAARVAMESGEH
jgi:hypothetical protein